MRCEVRNCAIGLAARRRTVARISTLTLRGKSGNQYEFEVWPINQNFNAVAAVYAVTRRYQKSGGGYGHKVIYIGETSDLSTRFDNHHKADCFSEHNANCICTHQDNDEDSRRAKEADLIASYNPPCND